MQSIVTPLRAYYMRLQVAGAEEAESLAGALRGMLGGEHAVVKEEHGQTIALLWGEGESSEGEEWDEQARAELVFFLRAWSGADPRREVAILEQGFVDLFEAFFRRAS